MFNPSFCQELSKRQPARRHPNFPSGTHDILVGDKRGARRRKETIACQSIGCKGV